MPKLNVCLSKSLTAGSIHSETTGFERAIQWFLYVEHKGAMYIHVPSIGMSNLKHGCGEKMCNLRKKIWRKIDRTCPACKGGKLMYHRATATKDQCYGPDDCPRCHGKGYWTMSDEARWEKYQEARACEQMGVEVTYATPYEAKAARVRAAKAAKSSQPKTEYQQKAARVAAVKARMNAQASVNNKAVGMEVIMRLQDAVADEEVIRAIATPPSYDELVSDAWPHFYD